MCILQKYKKRKVQSNELKIDDEEERLSSQNNGASVGWWVTFVRV